jgi:hypothetical protein
MKTSPAQQTIVDRCNCMASPAAIQQAEKVPVGGERFLQIAERNPQKKWHKLTRVAFQVSRLMEFCSLRAPQRSDSPHWYTEARLQRYLSAHVARGPLRELDGRARAARLRLEAEIYRPHLVRLELSVTPQQLEQLDAERRVPDSRGVPTRAALFRALVDEALAFRRAHRSPPRPVRGEPYPIDLTWPKDLLR